MKQTTIIMIIIAIFMSIFAIIQGGIPLLLEGLIIGARNMLTVVPLLIAAFTISGMIHAMLSEKLIKQWLGKEAGIKGVLIGAIAGGLIPGGPYVFLPIAASFFAGGAEVGSVLAFVTAKNLWSVTRLPLEIALLGTHITFARFTTTFVFPIIAGILGNLLYSKFSDSIREKIKEDMT